MSIKSDILALALFLGYLTTLALSSTTPGVVSWGAARASEDYLNKTVSTFDPALQEEIESMIDNPRKPSIIMGPVELDDLTVTDNCVDTDSPDDISCADRAAVIKYRKALAGLKLKRLQEKNRRLEKEWMEDKYGMRSC